MASSKAPLLAATRALRRYASPLPLTLRPAATTTTTTIATTTRPLTTTAPLLQNNNNNNNNNNDTSLDSTLTTLLTTTSKAHLRPQPTSKRLTIPFSGRYLTLDHVHLRDSCPCAHCISPTTRQKLFQTHDIPLTIYPLRHTISPADNSLRIIWSSAFGGENHESVYPEDLLKRISSRRYAARNAGEDWNYVLWDRRTMERDVQFVPYERFMTDDKVLYFVLEQLATYGLVFLKDVPPGATTTTTTTTTPSTTDSPHSHPHPPTPTVENIATRIGPLKSTFYGSSWDVISNPHARNIAYTPLNLGLHMDLLYYESPPGLQFLHCIANTVTGGSSYFSDAFRAAEMVRAASPMAFQSLTSLPITYEYDNDGQHYRWSRPMVVLAGAGGAGGRSRRGRIDHVNFSPPFQAPFEFGISAGGDGAGAGAMGGGGGKNSSAAGDGPTSSAEWRQFLHGQAMFGKFVDAPENQFELRLKEGEVAIFQNRRVLHARREFDPESGKRWLKGTYVDGDSFRSRLRTLAKKYRGGKTGGEGAED